MSLVNVKLESRWMHGARTWVPKMVLFVAAFGSFSIALGQQQIGADTSYYLKKSPGGQMTNLEPIGSCRDPQTDGKHSVLIMAKSNDLSKMRKDGNGWERALRRAPVTKASVVLFGTRHGQKTVVGTLEGMYLLRGFNDELRLSGTVDEMGPDGVNVTKAIDFELKSDTTSFASFLGDRVFECRLEHPQLISFE